MLEHSSNKRPRDLNQLAKSIINAATGETPDTTAPQKNPHAQALGRLGRRKGGPARAAKLTPEERREIARKAAAKRWGIKKS